AGLLLALALKSGSEDPLALLPTGFVTAAALRAAFACDSTAARSRAEELVCRPEMYELPSLGLTRWLDAFPCLGAPRIGQG
ncbi:MAG: hypothetical protein M3P00_08600, partial [Gemmatimonadota bacterium]|nr:hypothetical protein [Gemmatimonadota bacterium]